VRPVLLVDFDGVLNPFAASACPRGFVEYGCDEFPGKEPVRLNRQHATWLRDLGALYDAAWVSACPEDLNRYCAALIGLAPMPRVPMPSPPFDPERKVHAVNAYVRDRACAWVDDQLGEAAHRWASDRTAPTALVNVDPSIGMTIRTVSMLTNWAVAVRG
jgi:hypothetical protein